MTEKIKRVAPMIQGECEASECFGSGAIISGRYRIIRELGRGGMGAVYQVENVFSGENFALKTIVPEKTSDKALQRFQKEAKAASRLDHSGLIKVYDFDYYQNHPYFVMDLVNGQSLDACISRAGALPLEEILHIFIQLAFALSYAHKNGVIHRDLKPANIMIIDAPAHGQQSVKIVDFGLLRSRNLMMKGTR